MSKRRNYDAGFNARVAIEAVKGERRVSELATAYGVHPTMIHQWKKALLEAASDIFERGGKKKTEVDDETVRSLHAKIGELVAANDFLSRKLKPWTGKLERIRFTRGHILRLRSSCGIPAL
jgi:transposase